jgi:MFS family permease
VANRSLLSGVLGLMGIPGMILCGTLSDRFVRKKQGRKGFLAVLVFIWGAMTIAIGFAVGTKESSVLVTVLFLASALVVFGSWPPYYAFLGEMARRPIVGTVFGLANFIGFLSAWVAPGLTGWIKDTTGSFSGALYLSGGLLIVAAILILTVRPEAGERT